MKIEAAGNIIVSLTQEQRDTLEASHWRYMAFAGVALDDEFQQQAMKDRQTYAHLLKHDETGTVSVSSERAADFMAAVTGLEREWCLAWDACDFFEHGATIDVASKVGPV